MIRKRGGIAENIRFGGGRIGAGGRNRTDTGLRPAGF